MSTVNRWNDTRKTEVEWSKLQRTTLQRTNATTDSFYQ